jgi:hypothetical protein
MTRPIPSRFQLSSAIKQLRAERIDTYWRIWLMANGDFTLGTFLQLCDNGSINRVTWHEDGTESVFEVKNE